MNKFEHLEAWVSAISPDVIGITETWANSNVLDSELILPGYDMFRKDRPVSRDGGGVLLYVRKDLHAVEFIPETKFPEQIWCQIQDSKCNKFLIGICYRTPTDSIFSIDTHGVIRNLLNEIGGSDRHFLLMGDLNYNFRQWPPVSDTDGLSTDARLFCDSLDDNFLVQHVSIPTRNSSILDLIITDDPDTIDEVVNLGPLATSDHNALMWRTRVRTESVARTRQVFDYARANFSEIRRELATVDWNSLFNDQTIDQCWNSFKDVLQHVEARYVPLKSVTPVLESLCG